MENKYTKLETAAVIVGYYSLKMWLCGMELMSKALVGVENLAHKANIKKGLKDGSIVEIDGKYYKVTLENTPKGEIVDVKEA